MGRAATSSLTVQEQVAELLGISPDALDPDADLIASGLDSIRMMSLSGRWRRQGIDINFALLAENPTVAAWTQLVTERSGDSESPQAPEPQDSPEEGDTFPLAPIQHALWLGRNEEQALGGVAPHLYVEFDGEGVDPGQLRVAAAALARRHPMLRVEILPDGTQRITDRTLPVEIVDLRDEDETTVPQRLEEIRDAKSHQILHGEVLQIALTLLPQGRTRLHVDMDMSAADAVSYRNFMADLAVFYRGDDLPDLGYTYREYRAALTASAPVSDEDRRWWAERVPHLPEPPSPPLVPASEQANPRRNTRRWHFFDADVREALFAAAHRRGVTPAMAIAASYAGTLARWSTSAHFLLNLPMFGREPFHPDVEKLVGDFSSSLMLDVDLTAAPTAADRARVLQQSLHASAGHSSYSGLSVLRDLTRHRGLPTLAPFVFTSAIGLGDLFAGDVTDQFGACVWHISQGPQVLLDAQATPYDGGLLINWDVREDAFRPGVADAMFAHHVAELIRLAHDDSAWEALDTSAAPEEQLAVRAALNDTHPGSSEALHDGFFRAAEQQPDAPAVYSGLGDLTYGQLREQVLAVTATLRERGAGRGDTVAVMGPKTAEQIPALLGIHAAGAVYLPIGVDQPADRAQRILAGAGVHSALFCGPRTAAMDDLPVPALTVAEAVEQGRYRAAETAPAVTDPHDVAYVLFTSGSTGEPKGVDVTHDAAMNTVEFINDHFEIGRHDRCLALSTLECDISVLDIFGMLRAGGSIVVVDEDQRRDPDAWARLIRDHDVTVLHWLPGWLEMLVAVNPELPSVRVVPTGGDWVRTEMVRALRAQAPHARIAGLGGATETAIHNTWYEVTDLPAGAAVPLGRPLPNNTCRVVAPDGTDCPDWVPGEFWVGGRGVAAGYRRRPELTAEKFVEQGGVRWYRTGDLARYLPDGTLEFVGRADHRVKISGYRVELGEVEGALNRLPFVDGAVAAVVPAAGDATREQLTALVRVTDPQATPQRLTAAVAGLVPPHMVPDVLEIVETIPFTVGGKIDRRAAADLLVQAAQRRGSEHTATHVAPSTPLERALADIISNLLRVEALSVDDDFFGLGGDSVLATQLVAQIRAWLDTPTVMVADIFAARTVGGLATLLQDREPGSDRLVQVAEVYLEVLEMEHSEVVSALDASVAS
ncbi:non-ribosomal peptide synthetase [Mycolicibacterium confluentis]|uniref:Phenyloxazoline synthase MbtB n=1 Tax=Mycolicibacterium confluentis TaxID=28047 RepID=A0A7I7XUM1_9MYCO|nr:non-ribosomal peptide synthetase [Mycolicibacterium confluentis]MCV7322232.1 non-ribosomal peptide synthetase [Mycolicibacterium confluentis]ORV31455.1 non-ribosomal peptide synthetase [Mycolicibacterium confluentis]BBZ32871.1 phenyloxazoline synthase MbtB [Mycolicibacterium confluentis]